MNRLGYALALAGAAATIYLIVAIGAADLWQSLSLVGLGFFGLIPARLLAVGLDAAGWRLLIDAAAPRGGVGLGFVTWAALVREAVARLLPVASVGGDLVGIRLLMLRGLAGAAAGASVIVEIVVTLIAQFVFTAAGLALFLLWLDPGPTLTRVAVGLLLACPIPAVLILLLRRGRLFERGQRLAERLLSGWQRLARSVPDGARLDAAVQALIDHRRRLLQAVAYQFAGMVAGSLEVWLIAALLGHPIGALPAVALESVVLAARHLAFFIPAGLGVQEAGFVVFGQMLGMDSQTALAVSLIRRFRELCLGVPVLLSWQAYETWQARQRGRASARR